jgi:hypothetical protein
MVMLDCCSDCLIYSQQNWWCVLVDKFYNVSIWWYMTVWLTDYKTDDVLWLISFIIYLYKCQYSVIFHCSDCLTDHRTDDVLISFIMPVYGDIWLVTVWITDHRTGNMFWLISFIIYLYKCQYMVMFDCSDCLINRPQNWQWGSQFRWHIHQCNVWRWIYNRGTRHLGTVTKR